ncbi:MAG: hypothetical protein PHT03_03195, partial [Bacilli bacterium]|nr:hypothetical protein [Bacilli bacterium]
TSSLFHLWKSNFHRMGRISTEKGCRRGSERDSGFTRVRPLLLKEKIVFCNNNKELKEKIMSMLNDNTIVLFKVSMLDKSFKSVIQELQK